ncbi:MAG: hypothetical protein WCW13_01165 [archaeon]|jgi:hypothetical protein
MSAEEYEVKLFGRTDYGSDNKAILPNDALGLIKSPMSFFMFQILSKGDSKCVAQIEFVLRNNEKEPILSVYGSSEELKESLTFFRVYRQTPFRLLLFSALTLARKKGIRKFYSEAGMVDLGRGHAAQMREGLFKHISKGKTYGWHAHKIGVFPPLSLLGLTRMIQKHVPVPTRFLPPTSVLRKKRATSYIVLRRNRVRKRMPFRGLRRK